CDFATCGSAGLCRAVVEGDSAAQVAGCACLPGTTGRTTFAPDGQPIVACQDTRLSFLNPGDRELPDEDPIPAPCVDFDCGPYGECISMNMTPTCQCDVGYVAVGSVDSNGARRTRCVAPKDEVPIDFYRQELPARPAGLPGGREMLALVPPPP